VNYAAIRPRVRSGDLLAWSHRGWHSWYDVQVQLVRLATRSEYCHVGVAWRVGGRLLVLEAVSAGVRLYPLSRLVPFYWLRISGPSRWTVEVERWALERVGQPYSRWQAVLGWLGMLRSGADSRWQCAEYAQGILLRMGVEAVVGVPPTPTALVLVLQRQPGVVTWYVES
jgi:hypothetical protein